MKLWLDNWKGVAPVLEQERWTRLAVLTAEERAHLTLDLLGLWRPDLPGDDGGALIRIQRAFTPWRKRHA